MTKSKSRRWGTLGWYHLVVHTVVAMTCALGSLGCGGDGAGLSGSQCRLVDCSYDQLICDRYSSPAYLKIYYQRNIEGGSEYTAIMTINLDGVDQLTGFTLEGQEFAELVDIHSIGMFDVWPAHTGGSFEIQSGGQVGQKMEGKASFTFENGRFLTARFSCTVTQPI